MKKKSSLFACVVSLLVFVCYLGLSLSCASNKGIVLENGTPVNVFPSVTDNFSEKYDITLVSNSDCPSRILKVVSRDSGKVYYTVSQPGDTEVFMMVKTSQGSTKKKVDPSLVTTSELDNKYLLNEEDAKNAVEFLNQLEREYKGSRTGEGVLNKFEVHKIEKEYIDVWVKGDVEKVATAYGVSTTEKGHYETIEVETKHTILFIQHSTTAGADEILYGANDSDIVKLNINQILSIRDALSK